MPATPLSVGESAVAVPADPAAPVPAAMRTRFRRTPLLEAKNVATLLSPHDLRDVPEAAALVPNGARVAFDKVSFSYPGGKTIFDDFRVDI